LLYSEARVSGSGAGAPAQVKALCLFVAESCNLSCRYCFVQQNRLKPAKALMSAEVGSAAVDFLIEASGDRRRCEIDFFGGEPLLNWPVLREITAYARQKSAARGKEFAFTLTTNGELLTPQLAAYLEEEGFAAVLSLDGRSAVHDRMRFIPGEGGSYQRVLPRVLSYVSSNPAAFIPPGPLQGRCRDCWARYHCGGGCRAASYLNGDLAEPYHLECVLQRKRLECALYLHAVKSDER